MLRRRICYHTSAAAVNGVRAISEFSEFFTMAAIAIAETGLRNTSEAQ